MSRRTHPSRLLAWVGAALLMLGVAVVAVALHTPDPPPQPPASAATPVAVTPPGPSTGRHRAAPARRALVLSRSRPVRLTVPAIGVNIALRPIGLTSAGAIRTPPLGPDPHAYWLDVSPTPGQLGPATIIGHVDSAADGPAVFYRLGQVRQRDTITVTRADGVAAVFAVERIVEYPKAHFPTQAVYGNTDHAALRLITCGGLFDPSAGSYESNIVVYASLVSTHKA